jgi:hypothetical protein
LLRNPPGGWGAMLQFEATLWNNGPLYRETELTQRDSAVK